MINNFPVHYLTGIPAALLKNHLQFLAQQNQQNYYYCSRWNSDLQKYWETVREVSEYKFVGLIRTLSDYGFQRVHTVQNIAEFSVMGDSVTVWPIAFNDPVKLSFWGDDLEKIAIFDLLTGRVQLELKQLYLGDLNKINEKSDWANLQIELKFANTAKELQVLVSELDLVANPTKFDFKPVSLYFQRFDLLEREIEKFRLEKYQVIIQTKHQNNLPESVQKYTNANFPKDFPFANLETLEIGFSSRHYGLVVFTDRELFGTIFVSPSRLKRLKSSQAQKLLAQLEGEIEVGNYLVHEDYGVGIYHGFVVEDGKDYLKLEYASEDELFVPLEQIFKLTKYIGEDTPQLTRLGKLEWSQIRKSIKQQVVIAAQELAQHYARVQVANAVPVELEDSEDYQNFLAKFPYELTPDQVTSEVQIIKDLAKKTPMSRLLIGDVGYGKTELILRAAFKMVSAGGSDPKQKSQVVVLCPTTVLALQHYKTFQTRFDDTKYKIGIVSRHNSAAVNKDVLKAFANNELQILIGTHRLLSSDLQPAKLGLLVVDEEQQFGVAQKEKLKKLEYGVHCLYVTATPIPRTLSMALAAITDISFVQTPPPGRLAVKTEVSKLDWTKISKAIQTEVERKGQIFFVHNQIETIASIQAQLQKLLPEVRFQIGHGQMTAEKLDQVFTDFYLQKFDCLICTTIIENGLDLPNVNTIIINQAERLGLAQMYQLRGRVGRSSRQAYAYIMYQGRSWRADQDLRDNYADTPETKDAKLKPAKYLERLEAILSAQELGSGFLVASRDLEIRGAGNLLGAEQSGNIRKVGYSLYMQLLAEEIEKIKATQTEEK